MGVTKRYFIPVAQYTRGQRDQIEGGYSRDTEVSLKDGSFVVIGDPSGERIEIARANLREALDTLGV